MLIWCCGKCDGGNENDGGIIKVAHTAKSKHLLRLRYTIYAPQQKKNASKLCENAIGACLRDCSHFFAFREFEHPCFYYRIAQGGTLLVLSGHFADILLGASVAVQFKQMYITNTLHTDQL